MSFHESFWIATSAAAPVVALADVVALPDAVTLVGLTSLDWHKAKAKTPGFNAFAASMARSGALASWVATMVNLLVQAAL
jgi:hypothetical protein